MQVGKEQTTGFQRTSLTIFCQFKKDQWYYHQVLYLQFYRKAYMLRKNDERFQQMYMNSTVETKMCISQSTKAFPAF